MLENQFGIRKSKVGHGRDPSSCVALVKSGKGVLSVSFTEAVGTTVKASICGYLVNISDRDLP